MAEQTPVAMPHEERARKLLDKLWGDKSQTGQSVRKMAKELFPDITIPEEQTELAVAPIQEKVTKLETDLQSALARIAKREKDDDDMRIENDLTVKIETAAREYGLTDSGKTKMIERMKETGNVSDALAAAAYVVSKMPKPAPTNTPTWLPEAANLFGANKKDEQFESLHQNPMKYMDDQLKLFISDPDAYTRGDI